MRIVVCLKQILDPEVPPKHFRLDEAAMRPVQGESSLVMDPYAENALQVALQLRERAGGALTALCLGDSPADEVLRRALALTSDEAVRVWDPAWPDDLEAGAVAHALAAAIRAGGGADVVLCGRQSGDLERGLVGPLLAEELGSACLTVCTEAEPADGGIRALQESEGGHTVVESGLPVVITVTHAESNQPGMPKVKDLLAAKRRQVPVLDGASLGLDPERMQPRLDLIRLYTPEHDGRCELIEGEDGPARADALVDRLAELKLLG